MPLINGSIQIGRSGILTAQAGLSVVGNNMANAASPNYSRQRADLVPTQFTEVIPGKFTGTGVAIEDIVRLADDALNGRLRTAIGDAASFEVKQQALVRAEATFNELTTADLSTRMSKFFGSFASLETEPNNSTIRSSVLIEGGSLTNFIREMRAELGQIQSDMDDQIRFHAGEANLLASQIADLNRLVVSSEAGKPGSSGMLRDQREGLLKELSKLIGITTKEANGGAVNVFIGSEPLIQYAESRGLKFIEKQNTAGVVEAQVVFSDNEQTIELTNGRIHGLLSARDDDIGGTLDNLDEWVSSLILEVNQLHSLGQGQQGYSAVTSLQTLLDPTAELSDTTAAGVNWPVTNGVFNMHVYDSNGVIIRTEQIKVQVGIDAVDTSLNDVIAAINAQVPEVTASLTSASQLNIQSSSSSFTFGFSGPENASDATNFLAVMGINTFFQGKNGADIKVRAGLNEATIVAGSDGNPTNGDVAGALAKLADTGVDSLNGLSLPDHFISMIGDLAADTKSAQDNYTASDVVVQTLQAERDSVSGVSIDEEAISMITFQRMLQGSSRFVSIINQMMDEVLSIGR